MGERVAQQLLRALDDRVLLRADEPHAPGLDAFQPLGGIAHHEHRRADRGRLLLDAAGIGDHHVGRVAGVQVLVRIYNRNGLLTFAQDIEFRVMGFLFQAARALMGHAGMGGNGQFTRLVALDAIADERGPWRDTLTEDQDLGLRLLAAGGRIVHDNGTHVEQQGVRSFRALFRQRTRWSQGNLQALSLIHI